MESYMYFVFCVFFWGCANIVPPNGGGKDASPPELLFASPSNKSTHFTGQKIILEFDEYIQIKNKNSIKISPICSPPPKIVIRGKRIEVEISCPLDDKTTYTINFGKSIIDLNEGNILENFKYVFCRGPNLDSLNIGGNVRKLHSNEALSGALVGLYHDLDSLVPYYYTFTDLSGNFIIENIKDDQYILYSVLDKNNNFKYDAGELISMPETIIDFNTTKNLGLFSETPDWPIIDVKNTHKNLIQFEHTILEDSILILNTPGFWSRGEKFSEFWFKDSPQFIVYEFNSLIDSIEIYNPDSVKLELKLINNLNTIIKKGFVTIKSNIPIDQILSDKFSWKSTNDSIKPYLIDFFTIVVPIDFKFKTQESLIIKPGAIVGKNNSENDSISFDFDCNPNNYGVLNIKSVSDKSNLIIELFNENVINYKSQLTDSLVMGWIEPGNYSLRLFEDENKNNTWDPGHIDSQGKPEPIYVYPSTIQTQPNWETEILITF